MDRHGVSTLNGCSCELCREARNRRGKRRRDRDNRWLADLKVKEGCARCGYNDHPDALEFHHRKARGKGDRYVSQLVGHSRERIEAELAKCDVMCSNCHAVQSNLDRRARYAAA